MKKHIKLHFRQAVRNTVVPFFFLLLSLTSTSVWALQDSSRSDNLGTIKYIGVVGDQVVFQLNYENKTGETLSVVIKDEDGNTLYTGKFNDKKVFKQFRFYRSDISDSNVSFTLSTSNDKQSQVFQVAATSRVVEDVVVTKL